MSRENKRPALSVRPFPPWPSIDTRIVGVVANSEAVNVGQSRNGGGQGRHRGASILTVKHACRVFTGNR